MMKTYTVGILREDYNWRRNITDHQHTNVKFRRVRDVFSVLDRISSLAGRTSEYLRNAHLPLVFAPVDLYHLWRVVSYGSKPWVVSSSTGLPYGWPEHRLRRGLELLASDACKRILLTSNNALEWQRRKLQGEQDLAARVLRKAEVLHPPQHVLVETWDEKPLGPTLTLTLVGKHFFRKGGLEVLRVVDRLLNEGASLCLNIVSPLVRDRHSGSTAREQEEARTLIGRHPGIQHFDRLPNEEVLQLFKRSHIGLLPSWVETYGYTVLEAQACACPVITTDVFAFPEINNAEVGWMISVGAMEDEALDYDYRTDEGRALIAERIERGFYQTLCSILNESGMVQKKGEAALERIRHEHDPTSHAERLQTIYTEIMN